jgi:signal transduction histidine kinase
MSGIVVITAICSWWLIFEAPKQILAQSVELFRLQKVRMIHQGADRLSAVLGGFLSHLSDPLVIKASGLAEASTREEFQAALSNIARPWGTLHGMVLFVSDEGGNVLAVDRAAEPETARAILQHHHVPPSTEEAQAHLCPGCLRALGALSVTVWTGSGKILSMGIDGHSLARTTLGHLLGLKGSRAWLVDKSGTPLLGLRYPRRPTLEIPPSTEDPRYLTLRASLRGVAGNWLHLPAWQVVLSIPVSEVVTSVQRQVHFQTLSAGALLCVVLTTLVWIFRREQGRLQDEILQEAQLAHQDKLATLGLLAAGVEHEMRSGLGIALSMLSFAEEDNEKEEVQEHLIRVRTALERLMELSKDLMGYSRVDATEPVSRTSLRSVIEEALQVIRPQAKHGTTIVTRFQPDLDVWAPRGVLLQVAVNLLLNAIQELKGQSHGLIEITTSQSPSRAVLEVSDNGGGIPPEKQSEAFKPFYTTKPRGEGTGLGLWICRTLVSRIGGEISVGTGSLGGACFHIELPFAREHGDRKENHVLP